MKKILPFMLGVVLIGSGAFVILLGHGAEGITGTKNVFVGIGCIVSGLGAFLMRYNVNPLKDNRQLVGIGILFLGVLIMFAANMVYIANFPIPTRVP